MYEDTAPRYQFGRFSPNYYAQVDGIMLEAYPAMTEVIRRVTNLPPDEQRAWGVFLAGIGQRLYELGSVDE